MARKITKRTGRPNREEVKRIRRMIMELSKIYPVYVNGKPLHQLNEQVIQRTILNYAAQ